MRDRASRRTHSRFQLDVAGYRLLRDGRVVRLARQPMELLILLASRHGELITREEIARKFWSDAVFVDVDRSINRIVRELRIALHDEPERPRFVETVVGKGYRLIQPLEGQVRSIAVLPLIYVSGSSERDYVADGLFGELITQLGKLGIVRVISRTSVERFRSASRSVQAIATELQVDAVIEGAVRIDGSRIHVTASLVQAFPETQLWTGAFDASFADALAVPHDIAHAIASHLHLPVPADRGARIRRPRAIAPAALEAYLQGMHCWNRRTKLDLERALEHFQAALAIEPGDALAHAAVAHTNSVLQSWTIQAMAPAEGAPRARAAAERALALDDTLPEAHCALAGVLHLYEWNWQGAEYEYRRALDLNPGYASAHHWYSQFLQQRGRWDDCVAHAQRAQQLDPLSPVISASFGWRLHLANQADDALRQLLRTARTHPDFVLAHWYLGQVYEQQGQFDAAVAELERAVTLSHGTPPYVAALAHAAAVSGDRQRAERLLAELHESSSTRYVAPDNFAIVYSGIGDTAAALLWLRRGFEEHSPWMVNTHLDPRLAPLHPDPAFTAIVNAIGARRSAAPS